MAVVKFQNVAPPTELNQSTRYRPELNGFDDTVTPAWQMVPAQGSRFVQVVSAQPFTLESDQKPFATIAPESGPAARKGVYQIEGKAEGKANIIARDSKGKELGRLEVRVLQRRTRPVQFFLVTDTAPTPHFTKVKEGDVREWVKTANQKIFDRQLNLVWDIRAVNPITVKEDLKNPIDFDFYLNMPGVQRKKPGELRWHAITDAGDPDRAVFNVFCVWNFKNLPNQIDGEFAAFVQSKQLITAAQMEKSGANFNMCMMKDVADGDLANIPHLIFAHEAGHYLEGFPFHYPDETPEKLLMGGTGEITSKLRKRDVEAMTLHW